MKTTHLTCPELLRRAAIRMDHGDLAGARDDWHAAGELAAFHMCATRRRLEAVESALLGSRETRG